MTGNEPLAGPVSRRRFLVTLLPATLLVGCVDDLSAADRADGRLANTRQALLNRTASAAVSAGLVSVALSYQDDDMRLQAVAGAADLTSGTPATSAFWYRIGSASKALTALVAASLVDSGLVSWDATIQQLLPELTAAALPAYETVTLEDLLDHRGGVLAFNESADIDLFLGYLGSAQEPLPTTFGMRQSFFIEWLLAQASPPGVIPGQTFYYSNAGYVVASAMLQKASGLDFPSLFEKFVVGRCDGGISLGPPMQSSALVATGYQGNPGALAEAAPLSAFLADWNDVLNQPAGGVYATIAGYSLWIRQLRLALEGRGTNLPSTYVQRLQAAAPASYALGWETTQVNGIAVLVHSGLVDGFTCLVFVAADGSIGGATLSNTESPDAGPAWVETALNDVLLEIVGSW